MEKYRLYDLSNFFPKPFSMDSTFLLQRTLFVQAWGQTLAFFSIDLSLDDL